MMGLGVVVGEVLSMGVLFRFTSDISPYYSFAIAGSIGLIFSFALMLMVKEP